MECEEVRVKFYIGPEETSQQASKRRETLRRSINAAKKKGSVWQRKVVNGNSCRALQDSSIKLWDVGLFTTGSFWRVLLWTMDFALLPEYFGGSFDREYAEKLVIEAFEEDTGLKVGSGVAENDEEEEDEDQVGGQT
ncbi:hypothetical protein THAOC_17932 [Thalassiosira oceanica]|uniref:Uncharacterized protein n=1 Tax=Thalassiosira oceanica TaxID=159749 RepID=K0S8C9_THAOC|nr:hypothetical protein THAOC_17932 [Thalassiosira oceanica]|eukprot:EJK61560.1 hypothetical protein THAOC_17932 [Thalassiosira oceanica]